MSILKPIEQMSESEIMAEMDAMGEFTAQERLKLESDLKRRAVCFNWEGDPLKQPSPVILGLCRRIWSRRSSKQ